MRREIDGCIFHLAKSLWKVRNMHRAALYEIAIIRNASHEPASVLNSSKLCYIFSKIYIHPGGPTMSRYAPNENRLLTRLFPTPLVLCDAPGLPPRSTAETTRHAIVGLADGYRIKALRPLVKSVRQVVSSQPISFCSQTRATIPISRTLLRSIALRSCLSLEHPWNLK